MAFSKTEAFNLLNRAHQQKRLAHAYLISGMPESGTRELALQVAEMVATGNVSQTEKFKHPDVHVAEPESKSRRIVIEQIRSLEKELQMRSLSGGRKVAIIFDADRMQVQASNAFLKTLEEPPSNSMLLLTTAFPEMLLDTILSRCIAVPLAPVEKELSESQKQLLKSLADFFRHPKMELPQVFSLIKVFTEILQQGREKIQEEIDEDWKAEETLYKQSTDGAWLKDREEYYKALGESRVVQLRLELVETLMDWWADVLRSQQQSSHLDFPEYADTTREIAKKIPVSGVLAKVKALEELRENLNRNVQDALAIEVAFLKVFTS